MYYVYEWYNEITGEVFYVGKGTKNRYKVKKHNKKFNEYIKNNKCESRITKTFESEKDAFEYEYTRILELKSIGQCKCNIYNGGYGGSTEWWTDELKEKYSKNNVMKSESQRKRMSENNPMKNPETALKANSHKRRAVIINGIKYESITDAMKRYNTFYEAIAKWCEKGINPYGEICRFEDSEQVIFNGRRYNKGGSKPVKYNGTEYECVKDCAKAIGVSENTVNHWLKRGFDIKGNQCRYIGDETEYKYENPFKGKPSTPVFVNGKRYNSVSEASKELNIAKTTLYAYLQGRRANNKYRCTYDNQHPSQGNTDNSTLEGSTTNG